MRHRKVFITTPSGRMKLIILEPEEKSSPVPGILWIHGGGYTTGMAAMVYDSCGKLLARKYGAVVVSPEYRLSWIAPYPAALKDCYAALAYMWDYAEELNIDRSRIIVGGESAGGGLAAAVCLFARDQREIPVRMQLPLYPMLDCEDTDSSRDNHGKGWNTKKNHRGWQKYLGALYGTDHVPAYASAARADDVSGLPPCYTFVADGEPFYSETLTYVRRLKEAGVSAACDVYPGNVHAFDLLRPWRKESRLARKRLLEAYEKEIVQKP